MPNSPLHFSHPPPAGYYPKFGGSIAAISIRKGVAWDVDGLSTISVEFLMASREVRLVFELRKADGRKSIGPGSIPTMGKLGGY